MGVQDAGVLREQAVERLMDAKPGALDFALAAQ